MKMITVFLEDGTNYGTCISNNATETSATEYFVGKYFNRGVYPEEKMVKCVGIELEK